MPFFETTNLQVEKREAQAVMWLDVRQRSHNVLNREVLTDLREALVRVAADRDIKRLVIASRKSGGFLAGADLHSFAGVTSTEEARAMSALGQQIFGMVAALPQTTVAVIHGMCLGGGLELALACDYRVVVDRPDTKIGLPEVKIGLVPGWGGTQRLPRVIGLERAFQVILQQREVDAAKAREWGLADATAPSTDEALAVVVRDLAARMDREPKRPKDRLPLRTWRQRLLEGSGPGRWLLFRGVERILRHKVPDDMPAPAAALNAVRIGLRQGLAAGLAAEQEAIGRLAMTSACRNLITLFFLFEQARKGGLSPFAADVGSSREIRRVGVVGAGTMGAGIAQLAALKGFQVIVREVNATALDAGAKKIEELFQKAAERGLISREEAEQKFARVQRTTGWEDFEGVDLVIEAVVEDLNLKRDVFRELEGRVRPDAILATNTSSLSVAELQKTCRHPERVAGLHFFNPVHRMKLVEVIQAPDTAAAVVAALETWAAGVGKTPVVVRDSPGFIVNRILMPYINEAGLLVAEGMAVDQVDRVMRRFGMVMGPLRLLDQVGLDVAAHIARSMESLFGGRLPRQPGLERMAASGWLGVKSGKGFYVYDGKRPRVHEEALAALRSEAGVSATPTPGVRSARERLADARDRMVFLMVNEAAACLGEGLSERAEVIDLAMVLGTGWAPHRGGPLRYADECGSGKVLQTLEQLARCYGPRFEPSAELRRRSQSGKPFYGELKLPAPS